MAYRQYVYFGKEQTPRYRVKVVASSRCIDWDREGTSFTRFVYVTFPRRMNLISVWECADELFASECQHCHDCCGHWYTHTGKPRRKRGRTWAIPLRFIKNI